MKLLLTSAGITNHSISDALIELASKKPSEMRIGFIPTAKNVESNNATWLVKKLSQMFEFGYANIELIDPSADDTDWAVRLESKDVILVGGGNTFHLLNQIRKAEFDTWLRAHMQDKVYVGISAGSILATPSIGIASVGEADENIPDLTNLDGLGLVDFEVSPHSPESVSYEENEAYADTLSRPLYALDDNSAVKVVDGESSVISEGEWKLFSLKD